MEPVSYVKHHETYRDYAQRKGLVKAKAELLPPQDSMHDAAERQLVFQMFGHASPGLADHLLHGGR